MRYLASESNRHITIISINTINISSYWIVIISMTPTVRYKPSVNFPHDRAIVTQPSSDR